MSGTFFKHTNISPPKAWLTTGDTSEDLCYLSTREGLSLLYQLWLLLSDEVHYPSLHFCMEQPALLGTWPPCSMWPQDVNMKSSLQLYPQHHKSYPTYPMQVWKGAKGFPSDTAPHFWGKWLHSMHPQALLQISQKHSFEYQDLNKVGGFPRTGLFTISAYCRVILMCSICHCLLC